MDATGTGLSYRKEGFLALAEPNLRGSATELIGWLPVNIYRKWRHSPRDRHHLQGKRPAETESSTSSREPKWDFLLKVKQNNKQLLFYLDDGFLFCFVFTAKLQTEIYNFMV